MKHRLKKLYIVLAFCSLSGCDHPVDNGTVFKTFVPIEEVQQIPQNADYISHLVHNTPESIQGGNLQEYHSFVFKPWSFSHLFEVNPEDIIMGFGEVLTNCYREDQQKWNDDYLKGALKEKANFGEIDTVKKKGIMVANANLRQLPTDFPCFPRSDAFPFDYVQNSLAHAGDPVYISHFSKDKAWVFVQRSSTDAGFVKSSEVGIFSDAPPKQIQTARLAVVLKDNTPIYDALGNFWAYSKIGMNLFVVGEGADTYMVELPYKDTLNKVQWIKATVSKSMATVTPLEFTETNVKNIVSQLIGQSRLFCVN